MDTLAKAALLEAMTADFMVQVRTLYSAASILHQYRTRLFVGHEDKLFPWQREVLDACAKIVTARTDNDIAATSCAPKVDGNA